MLLWPFPLPSNAFPKLFTRSPIYSFTPVSSWSKPTPVPASFNIHCLIHSCVPTRRPWIHIQHMTRGLQVFASSRFVFKGICKGWVSLGLSSDFMKIPWKCSVPFTKAINAFRLNYIQTYFSMLRLVCHLSYPTILKLHLLKMTFCVTCFGLGFFCVCVWRRREDFWAESSSPQLFWQTLQIFLYLDHLSEPNL